MSAKTDDIPAFLKNKRFAADVEKVRDKPLIPEIDWKSCFKSNPDKAKKDE